MQNSATHYYTIIPKYIPSSVDNKTVAVLFSKEECKGQHQNPDELVKVKTKCT
jgi:hypothetical protein